MQHRRAACALLIVGLAACKLDVVEGLDEPGRRDVRSDAGAPADEREPDASALSDEDIDAAPFTPEADAQVAAYDAGSTEDAGEDVLPSTPPGLVAWWPLQNAGESFATDTSPMQAHGAFMAGAMESSEGLLLDGTDNCVHVASSALDFSGELTIALWIRTSTTSEEGNGSRSEWWKGQWLVDKDSVSVQSGWAVTNHFGKAYFNVNPDGDTLVSETDIADDAWHHIAGVRAEDGRRWLYLDGNLEDSANTGSLLTISNAEDLYLGCDSGSQHFGNGLLRDVQVYNAALSEQQVRAIAGL